MKKTFTLLVTPMLIVLLIVLTQGCSPKPQILPPEKFEEAYCRLLVSALDTGKVGIPGRVAEKRVEDMLKELQISRESYLATLARYNTDRTRWRDFTEKAAERLQSKPPPPRL